ncbi:MAG TPA: protein kinase, partial [Acidobacteriota bacterium]|nr:protein kinase [Acidobacteriota bacterium]
ETLRKKIQNKPLAIDELMSFSMQLTEAMSEAHSRGITHRDLKPANIIITEKGHLKLLDFGLAQMERATPAENVSAMDTWSKTKQGTLLGTIAYMSPEQALGKRVDHRTDIFSMGVLLYEMATGQQPFSGSTPSETIDKIIHNQPESVSRLNYTVPQELERIIRKCMEKDPNRRYQSSADILIDLRNLKRDHDSTPRSAERLQQVKSKKPIYFILASLFIVAVIAALMYRSNTGGEKEIRSLAVLPFKNVNVETAYLSDGITDSIINNLSPISQIRVMSRGTVFTYKNKEVDPRQVGKDLKVDGVVSGKLIQEDDSVLVTVDFVDASDGSQIWGGEYRSGLSDIVSLQSEISKEISNQLRIQLTKQEQNVVSKQYTASNEAYRLYLKGQFFLLQRTSDSVQKAMTFFQNAIDKDPTYALAYDGLADCYNYMGINGAILGGLPPKQVMPRAKELVLKAIQLDETLPQPHRTLGHIRINYDFDWDSANRELMRSIQLNPNDSLSITYQTFLFVTQGNFEEAHRSMLRFNELEPGYFPGKILSVGIQYYWMREFDNAIKHLQEVIEMAPTYPSPYYWLGATYVAQKDYGKAVEAFQKAVQYSKRAPVALSGLGMGLAKAGQLREAEAVLAELQEQAKSRYVPEFYLACFYAALQRRDEAFALLNKGYTERVNGLSTMKVNPLVDDLRSDPRFDVILKQLHLN